MYFRLWSVTLYTSFRVYYAIITYFKKRKHTILLLFMRLLPGVWLIYAHICCWQLPDVVSIPVYTENACITPRKIIGYIVILVYLVCTPFRSSNHSHMQDNTPKQVTNIYGIVPAVRDIFPRRGIHPIRFVLLRLYSYGAPIIYYTPKVCWEIYPRGDMAMPLWFSPQVWVVPIIGSAHVTHSMHILTRTHIGNVRKVSYQY